MKKQAPLITAIYCRISSDSTGEGLGVDRQEAESRALAKRLGWEIGPVFIDNDKSAYSGKLRLQYREILDAVRAGEVHGIVALHPDRLHRRMTELEEFIALVERHGIQIQTVQAGEYDLTGQMIARILGSVAQGEVAHGRERLKLAKEQAAASGKYRGGPRPFGYDKGGMIVRESEAKIVRQATSAILAGRTLASIALDALGIERGRVEALVASERDVRLITRHLSRVGAVARWSQRIVPVTSATADLYNLSPTRWGHLTEIERQGLRNAYAALLSARIDVSTRVGPPTDGVRGCLLCGVGHVDAKPSQRDDAWGRIRKANPGMLSGRNRPQPVVG